MQILWSGEKRVVCGASHKDAKRIDFDEGPVFSRSHDYMQERGIDFVRGVPTLTPLEGDAAGGLFDLSPPGSATDRFLSQLRQVGTGNREGGFFVMIGRKGGAEA